jgi:hypothetical protein
VDGGSRLGRDFCTWKSSIISASQPVPAKCDSVPFMSSSAKRRRGSSLRRSATSDRLDSARRQLFAPVTRAQALPVPSGSTPSNMSESMASACGSASRSAFTSAIAVPSPPADSRSRGGNSERLFAKSTVSSIDRDARMRAFGSSARQRWATAALPRRAFRFTTTAISMMLPST